MPYEVFPVKAGTLNHTDHVAKHIRDIHEDVRKRAGEIVTTYALKTIGADKGENFDTLYIVADIPEKPSIDDVKQDDGWGTEG